MTRLWLTLLARASHPDDRDWIVADAVEEYDLRTETSGARAARRWLRGQALRAIRPGLAERWRRRGRPSSSATRASRPRLLQLVDDFGRDAAHAGRSLRRSPALVVLVVGSLAVGIGATTVVFSVARSLLFPDPGPIADPERVVTLYETSAESPWGQVSFPNYLEVADEVPALASVAALRIGVVRLGESADGERLMVELVTGNYFETLGLPASLGRTFSAEETRLGSAEAQVVLSHEFWAERFASSPDVIGQTLLFDGRPHTIIGVGPPRLVSRLLQMRVAAWIPLGIPGGTYNATDEELTNRDDREYLVLGRLAPGANTSQVEQQLSVLGADLATRFPGSWAGEGGDARSFSVLPESESRLPPEFRPVGAVFFGLLLLATGLILAIACTNVAGLLLARAERRSGEVAIRVSIGAGRGRIMRMLLTESLILAGLGGALGVALTWVAVRRGAAVPLPGMLPDLAFQLSVDGTVLAFALSTATLCALLFGLAPAVQAARNEGDLSRGMRGGSRGSRGRRALVSLQVAGSVLFLVAAGLLARSVAASVTLDPGLRTDHLAVVNVRQDTRLDAAAWLNGLEEEVRSQANITEVALASAVEVSPFWDMTLAEVRLPGRDDTETVPFNAVTPNYAELTSLSLLRGRWLDDGDRAGAMPAVVVNERFAQTYFPAGDALGRSFTIEAQLEVSTPIPAPAVSVQIVGVAADVRNTALEEPGAYFWAPLAQFPTPLVMVHAQGPTPAQAAAALARFTAGDVSLVGPSTYAELTETNTTGQRAIARFLWGGALFALVLALIGLGGLLSVSVAMRLPELSIRQALGATRTEVVREVLAESGRLAAWGIALGLGAAIPLALLARSVLPGVSPVDPPTLLATALFLATCSLLAAVPSALRAARVNPLRHLRGD